MAKPLDERFIFAVLGFALAFLLVNFDQQLGIIFVSMLIIDFIIFYTDKFASFRTENRTDNRFEAVIASFLGYGVYALLSAVAVIVLTQATNLALFQSQVPVLSENEFITIIVYMFLIPIVETRFFFGRLLEFLADSFRVNVTRGGLREFRTWVLFFFVSAIFTLFHLSAKIAAGNIPLAITFVFGLVSCVMVVYYQELKQAIGLHIVNNGHSVLCKFGFLAAQYCGRLL